MDGIITDIHRTSLVDGPGIRTSVFLKGCSLRCLWCHNPETQSPNIELGLNRSLCIGCGSCIDRCPHGALALQEGQITVDRAACNGCMACLDACPTEALFAYGQRMSSEAIVAEVVKDRLYYDESGGGVTISGGEPMQQPAFTLDLLKRAKGAGLHTCLDTTGVGPREAFEASLDWVDLYLFDYKHSDPRAHQAQTGAALAAVEEMLSALRQAGAAVRLRCPIIPGLNDSEEHLAALAALSKSDPPLDGMDLLTWHTMGVAKYAHLGRAMPDGLPASNVSEPQKEEYRRIMAELGARRVTIL